MVQWEMARENVLGGEWARYTTELPRNETLLSLPKSLQAHLIYGAAFESPD